MAGRPRFVLGINSQLVEIDSNRRLSQIVRNLASSSIVVTGLWIDGYGELRTFTSAMVTTVCY